MYHTVQHTPKTLFHLSILSVVWVRPGNLIHITGYIGPGQAEGVKSSCMPDPPLACICCICIGRLLPRPGGGEHGHKVICHTLSTAMPKIPPPSGLERESMQAERC